MHKLIQEEIPGSLYPVLLLCQQPKVLRGASKQAGSLLLPSCLHATSPPPANCPQLCATGTAQQEPSQHLWVSPIGFTFMVTITQTPNPHVTQ